MSVHSGGSFQGRSTRSVPGSPFSSSRSQLSSLPPDMLTGLGDGPYPSLGRRLPLDPMEAIGLEHFGVPMAPEGTAVADTSSRSRRGSQAQSRKSSFASNAESTRQIKKAVLSMSMTDNVNSDQGLVKKQSGWASPFGSRPPSRPVTPSHSQTNLREKAKAQAAAVSPGEQTDANGSAAAPTLGELATSGNGNANRSTTSVNTDPSAKRKSSFFGSMRRKSQMDASGVATSRALAQAIADAPPVPSAPSPVSADTDSAASKSKIQTAQQQSTASKSASTSSPSKKAKEAPLARKRSKSESAAGAKSGRFSRFFGKLTGNSSSSNSSKDVSSASIASKKPAPVEVPKASEVNGSGPASPTTFHSAGSVVEAQSPRQSPVLRINGLAPSESTDSTRQTLPQLVTGSAKVSPAVQVS